MKTPTLTDKRDQNIATASTINTPLHGCTNVGYKVIKVLACEHFITHLKEHLLCLNKPDDWLQQRATALVLKGIEQRVVMNGSLHTSMLCTQTNHVDDVDEDNDNNNSKK